MNIFISRKEIKRLVDLFYVINRSILIIYVFFVIHRVHAFTFYMDASDIFLYVSFVFLASQLVSVLLSIMAYFSVRVIEKIVNQIDAFSIIYDFVNRGGYAASLFAFIFSLERLFIEQSWLNKLHVTEVQRAVFELFYGVFIFFWMVFGLLRARTTKAVRADASSDGLDEKEEKIAPKINRRDRRLFIASSASAVAAITVGRRIISGNKFDYPVNYSPGKDVNRGNVLLVTFDALSASDMSLYGYDLNTTPHIDAFAKSSDVYERFYTCSTFTTPGISSILTGRYPSASRIYQLGGMLHGQDVYRTLPALLKAEGYNTAAICGNPYAMPLMGSTKGAFDNLCAAPRKGWTDIPPSELIKLPGMTDMMDLAERMTTVSGLVLPSLRQSMSATPPRDTFEAAKAVISKMEGPFFVWIHVMAPHGPYLPSEEFRHRFLREGILETRQDMLHPRIVDRAKGKSQIQTDIEHLRLRYGEWISEADYAFGEFMAFMEKSGFMQDTLTMVSSDHGEFFSPNTYGHGGAVFHESLIHVPMIVKTPEQKIGRRINVVADQTAIAPTILDFAGVAVPKWMSGSSLVKVGGEGARPGNGFAVTQYLEENSSFKSIATGTIGAVTDGFQYVREIASGDESLYVLGDEGAGASSQLERERPDVKADMKHKLESIRDELRNRFPEVMI
ncbi:sulfatase [Thalassospira xiamenensis]|uniref:Arylsulfatase A n=1 Tax=Thalassospira xiamenensis TaxID=220697 RepID=A0A285TXB9_9PROT|nr:sulfatase [Thalassospira xiamenensis]SOC30128.1 Arylsulfatase A [Thalassospira xiamenensis]